MKESEKVFTVKDSIISLLTNSKKEPFKKAKQMLENAISLSKIDEYDSLHFKSLNRLAVLEFKNKNYLKFKKQSQTLLKVAFDKKDTLYLAKGFFNLGSYYGKINRVDSAYYHFNEAKQYYQILDDSLKVGSSLLNMSILQTGVGDYYGSENTILEALSYIENTKKIQTKRSLYNNFGVISYELRHYQDGLYWYKKALEITSLPKAKAVILNNIGVTYRDMKDYKRAIHSFEKGLEFDLTQQQHIQAMLIDNIGYVNFLERNPNALQKIETAFGIRKKIKNYRGQIVSKIHLGNYYIYEKDTVKAFKFLESAIDQGKNIKDSKNILKILQLLSENSSNTKYRDEYKMIRDSIFFAERNYKHLFAKIRYRTEQKENEYDFLENQFIEQTFSLKEQERKKIKYATLFIISLVLLIVGFYLFYQRKKIHQQQLLIEKLKARAKEKQAISVHLHDAIAGDILLGLQYSEKLQKKIQNSEFTTLILIFERAYEKARKISQDLNQFYFQKTTFTQKVTNLCREYSFHNDLKIIHKGIETISWTALIPEIKVVFFEIIQEGLTNILKHAKASEVLLTFYTKDKILGLIISDNGIGMDNYNKVNGIGILNMKNRVADLNGTIVFKSIKLKGTTIKIQIPNLIKDV
tara:strand:- start:2027 stop:3937 length:1911 start_codon:yes stop_codon:yes gene_type:complete